MSAKSLLSQPIEFKRAKTATIPAVSSTTDFECIPGIYEIVDTDTLAARWKVPPSWIRTNCGARVLKAERIPHLRLGRYIRFLWNSPELNAWLEARKVR